MHKGHGNIRAQRKRRRNNIDASLYIEDEVRMIDGNYTHYSYAWCQYHQGWLTKGMAMTHGCERKVCARFITYEETYGMSFLEECAVN